VILYDFTCGDCGQFEGLVVSGTEEAQCPRCGSMAARALSAPNVWVIGNDPVRKSEALRKRSYDHSMKEARKNAENIASKMGGVARAQTPWNVRSQKSAKKAG